MELGGDRLREPELVTTQPPLTCDGQRRFTTDQGT